jgi:hypothetical protein
MALYQHRFRGALPSGDIFIFSWWANSIRTTANANAAASTWLTAFTGGASGFASKVTAGVVFNRVSTGLINPAGGGQTELAEATVNIPGTAAGNSLPPIVALVVSLRTALANRRGRGRLYLPPLASSSLTTLGKVSTTTVTDINTALTTAWTGYNTGTDRPVVYSRTSGTFQNITSFNIGDLFDTQRRRDSAVAETRASVNMP